jgi:hypothetical protein
VTEKVIVLDDGTGAAVRAVRAALRNPQQILLQNAEEIVQRAAQVQKEGSFSDRNPALGRMVKCQFCKTRRRANSQIPCCNPKYKGEK